MSRNRIWVVELIRSVGVDAPTAELVVDRLMEEGLLHLGYGNADIDKVVEAFIENFGTTKTSRADRFAANRLVNKYGSQAVVGIIRLLAQKNTERYAPIVGSIAQLEDKWVSVLNFLRNSSTNDNEEIIVT
jgi:hypothetical protein